MKFKDFYNLNDLNKTTTGELGITKVYRTEYAHPEYKGKNIYGNGLYTSLSREEAEELTLDPHSSKKIYYNRETHGDIDEYIVSDDMKVVVFDLDKGPDLDKYNKLVTIIGKDNLNNFFMKNNIDGLVIKSEDFNFGGNQLVVYNTKMIKKVQK